MFDARLLPSMARLLRRPARLLARIGCTADAISFAGFACGAAAAVLVATGTPLAGLAALLANRVLDGLDGAVARLSGPTDRGAFLDITLDFIFYAAVPFAFACADPAANALPAAALLFAFMGTASSFLAFAVLAERRRLTSTDFPHKGLFYLGGLTEGGETIACFVAMCLFPAWFPALAWGFAALCAVTTCVRLSWGFQSFGDR
jgi:phosphatidylglycerophosphate synthase